MKSMQKSSMTITLLLPSNLRFLLFICFLPLIIACNNNSSVSNTPILEDENVVHIPEDFPSFYAKFHVDPEFQLNHVQFPLAGKSATESWQAETWEIHKPFSNTSEFKRDIENVAGIITETIMDNNGMFYIVRRFAKLGSDWKLIFYTQGTNLDGFVPDDNPPSEDQ